MSPAAPRPFDPTRDLLLERVVDVPREMMWEAWTDPAQLCIWFCPKPWSVSRAEIELRPGGAFRSTMVSPEGQEFPNDGCLLTLVPGELLVFTDALGADFRPTGKSFMTAYVSFESRGTGTYYRAHVMHADVAAREQHEAMGFHGGWGTALDQLVAHCKSRMATG